MSLGFEQAGFDVIAAVDVEEIHLQTYSQNFPESRTWNVDLSKASGDELRAKTQIGDEQIDVLFAGPPCQGFSLIGKRVRTDPRNLLLFELARLISELFPTYVLVENVEGAVLGAAKDIFDDFVRRLEDAGYSVVKPVQILDAADFGVPQRRRRVFILAHRAGTRAPKYPETSYYLKRGNVQHGPTVWDAIGDLPKISNYDYLFDTDEYVGELGEPSSYAKILRGEHRELW